MKNNKKKKFDWWWWQGNGGKIWRTFVNFSDLSEIYRYSAISDISQKFEVLQYSVKGIFSYGQIKLTK